MDWEARIAKLEAAIRDVVETSHGAGAEHWAACERARKAWQNSTVK